MVGPLAPSPLAYLIHNHDAKVQGELLQHELQHGCTLCMAKGTLCQWARWPRYPPPTQITVSSPRCSRNLATIWSSTLYVFSARSDRYPAPAALSGAGQRLSPGHSRPIGGGALGSTSHHFTSYAFLTNDKFAQRLITDDTVSRVHMCGCTCVYCCWCLLSLRSESAV